MPAIFWPRSPSSPRPAAPFDRMPLSALIEENGGAASRFRRGDQGPDRGFGHSRAGWKPEIRPSSMVSANILENAVDFARATVEVNAWWNTEAVEIVISDDGPGICARYAQAQSAEPYLSRAARRR